MSEHSRRIGYLRLSSTDQRPNVQTDALERAGCGCIHRSTSSGTPPVQGALQELRNLLDEGDQFIVYRLDRLTRDEYVLADFRNRLEAMGVTLVIPSDMPDEAGGDYEK